MSSNRDQRRAEDIALAMEAHYLREIYAKDWEKHRATQEAWRLAVEGEDTLLGYWEWLASTQRSES